MTMRASSEIELAGEDAVRMQKLLDVLEDLDDTQAVYHNAAMRRMKVLVIGGGGREHALAWKLAQAERVQRVFVAPGNGGTARDPQLHNVDITDIGALADFAAAEKIGLTVVGPEAPLAAGVVDLFRERGLRIFGPTRAAAQLESSKAFAKAFMQRHRIPTAALRHLRRCGSGARPCAGAGRADRHQGRWPGRRQGRGGGDDAGHGL